MTLAINASHKPPAEDSNLPRLGMVTMRNPGEVAALLREGCDPNVAWVNKSGTLSTPLTLAVECFIAANAPQRSEIVGHEFIDAMVALVNAGAHLEPLEQILKEVEEVPVARPLLDMSASWKLKKTLENELASARRTSLLHRM